MTSRSPTQQHRKTTTISQRLRSRTNQNLSVQPPEIFRLRNVRPRRAATLLEPRYDPLGSRHQGSQQLLEDPANVELAKNLRISSVLQLQNTGAHHQSVDFLEQFPNFRPYSPPLDSTVASTQVQFIPGHQLPQHFISEIPPSPLPSVSGSINFDLPSTVTNPQQSHSPYTERQDMRYVLL